MEKLKRLHIPKRAFAITPIRGYKKSLIDTISVGDSLRFDDRMEGTTLTSFFKDGIIDSLRIEGMAKTVYHIFEDSIYQGKNNSSGDTIALSFNDNDLNKEIPFLNALSDKSIDVISNPNWAKFAQVIPPPEPGSKIFPLLTFDIDNIDLTNALEK